MQPFAVWYKKKELSVIIHLIKLKIDNLKTNEYSALVKKPDTEN